MSTTQKCPVCGAVLVPDTAGGHCLRCLLQLALTPVEPAGATGNIAHLEQPGDKVGRYMLLQQIGEGGCGVVYMAEQEEPVRRYVAIKVIKLGMDTRSVIARFEAEQQAMALMDHPHIAKVFDAGVTNSGRPFFAMELVRGIKITEFCDRENLSTRARLDLFKLVCHAIQHAHQKGVIHRDVKPSNILVALDDGVPVPKVIDFGIAKATQQRLTDKTLFTAFEQFIGTPAYMSPEQADLGAAGIDTRSDIYSLGVLLYELLTGQTPFDAKAMLQAGMDEIRRTIREREPAAPSTRLSAMPAEELAAAATHRRIEAPKLIGLVRGDLDWIVMKALEKDRSHRYETANGLAMDVQRHLQDEPVVARPPGNFYRFQKLVRRHRLIFAAATAALAALLLGLGLTTWQYVEKSRAEREQSRLRAEAQLAQAAEGRLRRQAEAQELTAQRKTYAISMNLAEQALQIDNLGRAVDLLRQQQPEPGKPDFRGWEWRYLWQFCRNDAQAVLCERSNTITSLACSGDGARVAVATGDGQLTLWGTANGERILQLENDCGCVWQVSFSPTGNLLAFGEDTNVVVWNCRNRMEVARLPVGSQLRDLKFVGESRVLTVARGGTNNATIWDLATQLPGLQIDAPIHGTGVGTKFATTADGSVIAYAISNKLVRVVDLERNGDAWTIPATEEHTTALAFSADGKILATGAGYTESAIKLWNVPAREYIGQLEGHRSWIAALKFLPEGRLASASADQTIRIWDVASRQSLHALHGHHSEVRVLDATADGRTLYSGSKDGTVLVWDVAAQAARPQWCQRIDPKFKPGSVSGFEFSPDSRMIAVVENEAVKIYDAATLAPILAPDLGLNKVAKRLLFSPDSRLLVATDSGGQVGVWDVPSRRHVTNFVAHAGAAGLLGSGFLNGGRTFLTWGTDNLGKEWDITTWAEKARWPLTDKETPITTVWSSSSTNGLLAIKLGGETNLQVFTASAPTRRRVRDCPLWVVGVSFSPDEKTLATACEDGSLTLWDARTLERKAVLHDVLLGLHSVAFSPDGHRIAAGSNGREAVKIWDADSHEDLLTLEGQGSLFSGISFSPDGNLIAACGWSGILHVWRAPTWAGIGASP